MCLRNPASFQTGLAECEVDKEPGACPGAGALAGVRRQPLMTDSVFTIRRQSSVVKPKKGIIHPFL